MGEGVGVCVGEGVEELLGEAPGESEGVGEGEAEAKPHVTALMRLFPLSANRKVPVALGEDTPYTVENRAR